MRLDIVGTTVNSASTFFRGSTSLRQTIGGHDNNYTLIRLVLGKV